MKKTNALLLCALLPATSAHADAIYSNIDAPVFSRFGGTLMLNQAGALALNRIDPTAGGTLASITFSAGAPEIGPVSDLPIFSSATVFVFADDGDFNPDDDGDMLADPDQLLFQSDLVSLPALLEGEHLLHTIDVSAAGVLIPHGASLWVGVQFSSLDVGQVGYRPPAFGSTSGDTWTGGAGLSSLGPDTGLGFELTVPSPGVPALLGLAGLIAARRRR